MITRTNVPDYLYHYTSIDTLEKIIESRKIRFNSLKNVDDSDEMKTGTNSNMGKNCFVSCWTDIETESIPFWGLYTDNMQGVRIKLKTLPFKEEMIQNPRYNNGERTLTSVPKNLFDNKNLIVYITMPFCRRVIYTENPDKLYPIDIEFGKVNGNQFKDLKANFMELGQYKRSCWQFQSEWRYNFFLLKHDGEGNPDLDFSPNHINLGFEYVDIQLREDALVNMEITLGPRMNDSDKERVTQLLKINGLENVIVKDSKLNIN